MSSPQEAHARRLERLAMRDSLEQREATRPSLDGSIGGSSLSRRGSVNSVGASVVSIVEGVVASPKSITEYMQCSKHV